jgi:uncharacterized protein
MMKKLINTGKCLLLFVFLTVNVFAKNTKNEGNTFLWEVKPKNQPDKTLYLLGSIHIGIKEMYPLNPIIMDAWNKSDVLGVEIDIGNIETGLVFSNLIPKLIDMETPLYKKLPTDIYEKLKEKFNNLSLKFDLSIDYIDYLTPLGAALCLELQNIIETMMNEEVDDEANPFVKGIDMFFLELAREEDKKIIEVESVNRQIQALEELNEFIVDYIKSLLERQNNKDNYEDNYNELIDLVTAWKDGDVKKIEKLINNPFSSDKNIDAKIKNALLYKRNQEIATKIEQYFLDDEKYFIIIGAGHFVGKNSIIDFLNKTGKYNIKRL